jgi:hypothetical protein
MVGGPGGGRRLSRARGRTRVTEAGRGGNPARATDRDPIDNQIMRTPVSARWRPAGRLARCSGEGGLQVYRIGRAGLDEGCDRVGVVEHWDVAAAGEGVPLGLFR